MHRTEPNYYVTLGLDAQCTTAQIRAAYRLLAKQHHPDVNPSAPGAKIRTQAINAAYEILNNPERRQAYDQHLAAERKSAASASRTKIKCNISQDIYLRHEDFLRGTTLEVRVNDPANRDGQEIYELLVPPESPPGKRFQFARTGNAEGGLVHVRIRPRADFRFKVRGSDLRCDLRIQVRRAALGGTEMIAGVAGTRLRVQIPPGVARGEIIRLPGEGLPKPRGGRGDLLVRIIYRPEVRISRPSRLK